MIRQYSRREFIKAAGLAYGSVMLLPACSSLPASGYRVFTEAEADCLMALCEQMIPADQDPGATQAGVIRFIVMNSAHNAKEKPFRNCLRCHGMFYEESLQPPFSPFATPPFTLNS
jgi:hypothetical protein